MFSWRFSLSLCLCVCMYVYVYVYVYVCVVLLRFHTAPTVHMLVGVAGGGLGLLMVGFLGFRVISAKVFSQDVKDALLKSAKEDEELRESEYLPNHPEADRLFEEHQIKKLGLMQSISFEVQKGASSFLNTEMLYLSVFALIIFFLLGALVEEKPWWTATCFMVGAIISAITGFIGMSMAVRANGLSHIVDPI